MTQGHYYVYLFILYVCHVTNWQAVWLVNLFFLNLEMCICKQYVYIECMWLDLRKPGFHAHTTARHTFHHHTIVTNISDRYRCWRLLKLLLLWLVSETCQMSMSAWVIIEWLHLPLTSSQPAIDHWLMSGFSSFLCYIDRLWIAIEPWWIACKHLFLFARNHFKYKYLLLCLEGGFSVQSHIVLEQCWKKTTIHTYNVSVLMQVYVLLG